MSTLLDSGRDRACPAIKGYGWNAHFDNAGKDATQSINDEDETERRHAYREDASAMINILASLAIWAVVKLGFLWVFVPKGERGSQTLRHIPDAENDPSVVESHDGHVIDVPLRSESRELNRLNSVQISGSAYAFRDTKHFMEGR